jgi:hypothetical protein
MKLVLFDSINMTFSKSRLDYAGTPLRPSSRVSNLRQPWRSRLFPVSTPALPDMAVVTAVYLRLLVAGCRQARYTAHHGTELSTLRLHSTCTQPYSHTAIPTF